MGVVPAAGVHENHQLLYKLADRFSYKQGSPLQSPIFKICVS